jgi:hypothetical protein
MDDREVLGSRIERSLADIGRAKQVLNEMASDQFLARMRVRFDTDFTRQQKNSLTLLEEVHGGKRVQDCWDAFTVLDANVRPLLEEFVSLMQGTMERRAGLDEGMCDIADAMLEHLCRLADVGWRRFTVPGSDYLTERTGVVRVRFPAASIWDLPFLAHEFGHVIEHEIRADDDDGDRFEVLTRYLTESTSSAQQQAFLREHYADILATYAVGPMFGWAIICQQVDPVSALDREGDLETHPADAKRVHMILRTLESMDEAQPNAPKYGSSRDQMTRLWEIMLAGGNKSRSLPVRTIKQLDRQQAGLFRIVDENLYALRYSGWERARTLAEYATASASPVAPDPAVTIVDTLNAAWIERVACADLNAFALQRMGLKFEKICQNIVKRGRR